MKAPLNNLCLIQIETFGAGKFVFLVIINADRNPTVNKFTKGKKNLKVNLRVKKLREWSLEVFIFVTYKII